MRARTALAMAMLAVTSMACSDDDAGPTTTEASSTTGESPPRTVVTLMLPSGNHDVTTLIGRSEAEATATAEDWGATVRVVERDGQAIAGDAAFVRDRVDLVIADGKVVDAYVG